MKKRKQKALRTVYLNYTLPRLEQAHRTYSKLLADESTGLDEKRHAVERLEILEQCIALFYDNGIDDETCTGGEILEVLMDMPLERIIHMDEFGTILFHDLMDRVDKTNASMLRQVNRFAGWLEKQTRRD